MAISSEFACDGKVDCFLTQYNLYKRRRRPQLCAHVLRACSDFESDSTVRGAPFQRLARVQFPEGSRRPGPGQLTRSVRGGRAPAPGPGNQAT